MLFGFPMPKMNPNGRGFESPSNQLIIFQIKSTKIVKPVLESAKFTVELDRNIDFTRKSLPN
jgi:hypothetical protein